MKKKEFVSLVVEANVSQELLLPDVQPVEEKEQLITDRDR